MVVKTSQLLDAAATQLARRPDSTLSQIADAAGVSRTTLFYRFGTRQALVDALTRDTLAQIHATLTSITWQPHDVRTTTLTVTTELMPFSERLQVVARESPALASADATDSWAIALAPLLDFVTQAQACGALKADAPASWQLQSLVYLMFAAWDAVSTGEVGARQAARLATEAWLHGTAS